MVTALWVGAALTAAAQSLEPGAGQGVPRIAAPPLAAGPANGAIEDGAVLVTSLRLSNTGSAAITHLTVTSTSLKIGALTIPGTLVGGTHSLAAFGAGAAYGSFPSAKIVPGPEAVTVTGTYQVSGGTQSFSLQSPLLVAPPSPGSGTALPFSATVTPPSSTAFAHGNTHAPAEANPAAGWLVPIGVSRPGLPSPEASIHEAPGTDVDGGGPLGVLPEASSVLKFYINQHVSQTNPAIPVFPVNEPSGAASNTAVGGGVVLVTFNAGAAFSTTLGATWTPLDPTTIFRQSRSTDYQFCCDQIVVYVPSIDRFVWLLQYNGTKGNPNAANLERIAYASPAAIIANAKTPAAAWTHFDITPTELGFGSANCAQNSPTFPFLCFDYPDLAVGDSDLYASFNSFATNNFGRVFVRVPLSQLQVGDQLPTISGRFTVASDGAPAWASQLMQGASSTMYWAGHTSNSSLRVFSWPEGSSTYSWQDLDIQSWPNVATTLVSSTPPPSVNWIANANLPNVSVVGATRVAGNDVTGNGGDNLYFAWTGGIGNGFPHPQVQWVQLLVDPSTKQYSVLGQRQLWSTKQAIVYPALASNSLGDVGFSVETGGGAKYENHAVGILRDPTLFLTTTKSNVGTPRFGDYATIHQDVVVPVLFDAFGYGVDSGVTPIDTRFVVFGRPPAPTYDQVVIGITTGDDDVEGGEVRATLSGQKVPLCLKPSNDSSIAPDGICSSGSDATDQHGSNNWQNFTFNGKQKFWLDTPRTSPAGFGTITITLVQPDPTCFGSCDNWDLQGVTLTVVDSTGSLPPVELLNVLAESLSGDDCFARLKGTAQGNAGAVKISLSSSNPTTPTHLYVGGLFDGETTTCINNGGP